MSQDPRQALIDGARRLVAQGLTAGLSGNLSLATAECIWITPSGMAYDTLRVEDIVAVSREGAVSPGQRRPSVELGMHLGCYRADATISAVVHAHPTAVIALAMLGEDLPCVTDSLAGSLGGGVPCVPYAPSASPELAELVATTIGAHRALILASHGLVTAGATLDAAIDLALLVERTANSYLLARAVGPGRQLPAAVALARRRFVLEDYGQTPSEGQ
ncbi:MAG: class II aldolase/adducin family protein [Sulfobacillus sp.]